MRFVSKNSTVSWIGSLLIFIGLSMMLVWGLLSLGFNDASSLHDPTVTQEPSLTSLAQSPTTIPDLLVPTRTPTIYLTITITTSKDDDGVNLPRLTKTTKPPSSPTPTPPLLTATTTVHISTPSPYPPTVTATTSPEEQPSPTPTMLPTALPEATETATVSVPQGNFQIPKEEIYRLGVSLPYGADRKYGLEGLGVGWVMDWTTKYDTSLPSGIEFIQTVSLGNGYLSPGVSTLTAVAAKRQGSTWLISNEPDVRWQNNVPPEAYARMYFEAYTAIKSGDPTAIVAAGGIAQPSPLRFEYLDMILTAYQSMYGVSMPAEAWQIHNYMLREEREAWGIDIPPGISADTGVLYGVDDTGNIVAFKSQIYSFRRWMVERGYGGLPLIVSEYGIPMPPDYGYEFDTVSEFMREVWHFFYTATDSVMGNPADGGRLVQRWCWFSLGVESYPAGNLLNPPAGGWTPLADVWRGMVEQ